jgi:hypothetical protein
MTSRRIASSILATELLAEDRGVVPVRLTRYIKRWAFAGRWPRSGPSWVEPGKAADTGREVTGLRKQPHSPCTHWA